MPSSIQQTSRERNPQVCLPERTAVEPGTASAAARRMAVHSPLPGSFGMPPSARAAPRPTVQLVVGIDHRFSYSFANPSRPSTLRPSSRTLCWLVSMPGKLSALRSHLPCLCRQSEHRQKALDRGGATRQCTPDKETSRASTMEYKMGSAPPRREAFPSLLDGSLVTQK